MAAFAAIIDAIILWATSEPAIRAVALVGSYARETAQPDSDIDLVLLTADPGAFRKDAVWLDAINWKGIGTGQIRWEDEDYGALWSRRVWLKQGDGEIEFGFASSIWANVKAVDPGTRRVISEGCRILYDPDRILNRLCTSLGQTA